MRPNAFVPQLIKQGQRLCSVTTPDAQLFVISTSKTTKASLNNLQKQQNYNTENSEYA